MTIRGQCYGVALGQDPPYFSTQQLVTVLVKIESTAVAVLIRINLSTCTALASPITRSSFKWCHRLSVERQQIPLYCTKFKILTDVQYSATYNQIHFLLLKFFTTGFFIWGSEKQRGLIDGLLLCLLNLKFHLIHYNVKIKLNHPW